MSVSVISAASSAWDRMVRVLFQPFDFVKWLILGFCAFLAFLFEGGGGGSGGGDFSGRSSPGGRGGGLGNRQFADLQRNPVAEAREALASGEQWIQANVPLTVVIAAGVILLVLLLVALTVLVLWLNSRGKFMFLDGIVHNRGAVIEPWRRFKSLANSLFWFRLVFGVLSAFISGVILLGAAAIAWPDIVAWTFASNAVTALALGIPLSVLWVLLYWAIYFLLKDFIVPVMYLRDVRVMAAWRIFGREVLRGHFWALVRFYLLAILIAIVAWVAMFILMCATLCIFACLVALPYIGSMVLLPYFVFNQAYGLAFLEQLGDGWRFYPPEEGGPPAGDVAAVRPE